MTLQVNSCFNLENNKRVEKELRNEEMKPWRIKKESTSLRSFAFQFSFAVDLE